MFVNREEELRFLNGLLNRDKPGKAQFVLVYGRRRVGKSELIRKWAEQSGLPFTYWAAEKTTSSLQRRQLYARIMGVDETDTPVFNSWSAFWTAVAPTLVNNDHILLIDEITYIADADQGALSALQHAWDQHFKDSNLAIVISGSQVQTMASLMYGQSPLFGRLTGNWYLRPLPFSCLSEFFPNWSPTELVNLYATVGGVPAYLEWLDPNRSYINNLDEVLLSPGSMFLAEPRFLLYDEVREPRTYLSLIKAIGAGHHAFGKISEKSFVNTSNLPFYLHTLNELGIVEKRLPATVKPNEESRTGRYHLSDPYFRFYFRFLDPLREDLAYDRKRVFHYIQDGLNSYVGTTAFEELSRQWVYHQSRQGKMFEKFEQVGQYWSKTVQIDVVGINWKHKALLLGECKWEKNPLSVNVVKQLINEKTPRILKDLDIDQSEWRVRYAFFSKKGFTAPGVTMAESVNAYLVSLDQLVIEVP